MKVRNAKRRSSPLVRAKRFMKNLGFLRLVMMLFKLIYWSLRVAFEWLQN